MDDRTVPPDRAFADLEPFAYGAEHETPFVVFGLELALPLLFVAVLLLGWARHRLRARRADAVEQGAAAPALAAGPAVVRGVVDVPDGTAVVKVTIEQLGVESKQKSSWSTTWSEVDRRTEAAPFQLRLASGARLEVRPGPSPLLVDDLSGWARLARDRRQATAALTGGEEVFARGELVLARDPAAGYRGGDGLVLGAPRGGRMELSTHGLARPARERAARCARWAIVLLGATAIAQLLAAPYHAGLLAGERRLATITSRWTVPGSKKKVDTHFVSYRVEPGGRASKDEVTLEDQARLREGTVVPVFVTPLETTIGPHPTVHAGLVLPAAAGLLVLGLVSLYAAFRRRAWYEVATTETVSGRLDRTR
jgi:hypothetical protein